MQIVFVVIDDDRARWPDIAIFDAFSPAILHAQMLANGYGAGKEHYGHDLTIPERLDGIVYYAPYVNDGADCGSKIIVKKVEVQ